MGGRDNFAAGRTSTAKIAATFVNLSTSLHGRHEQRIGIDLGAVHNDATSSRPTYSPVPDNEPTFLESASRPFVLSCLTVSACIQ